MTLKELFGRITFNILAGNTDDHAHNHAAFWDGKMLTLTPAYNICPQNRTGNEASQVMAIFEGNRMSKLSICLDAAHMFLLSEKEALGIIEHQLNMIHAHWEAVCDEANLTEIDRKLMLGRQFLNPFAFDDLEGARSFSPRIVLSFSRKRSGYGTVIPRPTSRIFCPSVNSQAASTPSRDVPLINPNDQTGSILPIPLEYDTP